MSPLGSLQSRARNVPGWIRAIVIGVSALLPIYWMVTESGLFAWIAGQEASMTGGTYHPKLVFLLSWIVTLIPAGLFIHVLASFFRPKP